MNDQLTGATGKLGIFGRTLSQINNDLSKGKFASLFHLVPKSEITALQSYGQALLSNSNKIKNWDKALAKGKINQQTYNQTIENTVGSLKGLSTTSQLLGIKIKQLHSDFLAGKMSASEFTMQVNTLIGAQKAATVATQVLGTALRTAFNIGIGIAISAIISWIQDLITENQRMAEISKQAADEIKDELNGLEDYSEKIISLRKELESTNITTERATDVRQELYDIQKDLIENYGAEKDSIDLVTGSIKDQIEELKNLGKQKYDSQYYSNYQATQTTLGNLNNLDLVLDDRAWRDYANQMWQNSNASRFRDDVQDYMKSVLESAGFKYEGGFYKLDGNAFDVNDALVSVEKQVEQAINSLDINDYPNPAAYADAEKQLRHVLEYLSAVNKDVTSPLIEHEEELAQYIKYNEKYSEQYWKLFTARANYESAQERGIQEEIIAARKAFIDTYNALVIDEEDNAVQWWFEKEFGEVTNESDKTANTIVKNLNPVKESLSELNTQLEEVYNSFDTAFSNQSTIQSAFDKIQSGTDLTASEMRGLIKLCKKDFPEIGSLFTKTAKGYTISADDLIRANNAIMNSVKETVESQIKGYQEIIDAWGNRKYDDRGFAENLGIAEAEYNDAKQQIENLNRALDTLGLSLENSTDKLEEYNKVLKSISTNLATGVSAQKEMNESGKISASTLESLLSLGEDYIKCITIENGIIKFNAEEYKKLEKAKIDDKIATIELTEAEIIYNRNQAAMYGNSSRVDELNALLADEQAKRKLLESLRDNYDTDWTTALTDKTSKNDDPIKDAFQKRQKELEHLLNMEQITEAEYYKQLFDSKEYKALLADRTKYADELNSIDEKFYKFQQDKYKEDADKQFDDLEDQYKRGIITAEQYAQGLHDLGQELYGEGSIYGGTEFAIKALEELDKKVKGITDDIYSERLDALKKANNGTIAEEEKFVKDWTALNDDLYKDNPKEREKNYTEIANYTKDYYKKLLENGTYDTDQYESKIKEIFFRLNALGVDLGRSWLADALEIDDNKYEELKKKLAADGDTDLNNVIDDVNKLAEKNIHLFADTPETLKKNGEEIFNALAKSAQDALSKGLISPERYLEIIDTFADTWQEKLGLTQGVIDEAKNALEVDDWMDDWDKTHNYDDDKSKNNFDLRQDRIDEYRKKIIETYGVDGVNNLKAYTEAMKEADEQQQKLNEDIYAKTKENLSADGDKTLFNILSDADELWNETLTLFAGNDDVIKSNAKDIFGTVSSALEDALKKGIITVDDYESLLRSWADTLQMTEADITDALVDTYEYRANALQKANDGSLASERKYIADMKSLNFSTYGDENSDFYDPNTYASNLRDITDHQLDVLEKALNNGEISVQEYANSVVEIFKDADVLGADYVSEKLDDIDKVRAEREKTYWEQQKELMEDYYDKQIKEIEETQKAKEKENKLEELHLKLIKARQTLEEAKNNRNQLVFHDGTFEYLTDQDAIKSAEEEVANTLKEIEDEKLQRQIDLLEEQKDAALGFYDQILDEIDFYLNKTLPLSESDQEELAKIRDSDYAQYARDKRDGNLTANSDNVFDIGKLLAEGFNFANLVKALGGNPTAEGIKNFQDSYNATLVGKHIVPSTLPSNITNNSSTTNNNAKTVINIGKIFENLYMPEGTTKEQVEAFFKHLNSAILQRIPQALIEVSK